MRSLNYYLLDWHDRPYEIGLADCATFVTGWIENLGHDCSPFIGDYLTKYEGLRKFARGGLHGAFREGLKTLGWVETGTPDHGTPALTNEPDGVGIYSTGSSFGPVIYEFSPVGLLIRPMRFLERGYRWNQS